MFALTIGLPAGETEATGLSPNENETAELPTVDIETDEHGLKMQVTAWVDDAGIPPQAKVFLIAMLPIFELRGAIPWGMTMERGSMSWLELYLIAVAGNMVPVFFIMPILRLMERLFSRIPAMRRFLDWLFARTRSRSAVIEKYEEIGLILFVAIPLPATGGWTGAMASYLFGLSYWKSILFILAGVCIAGIVVMFLSSMLLQLGLMGLAILVGGVAAWLIIRFVRRKRHGSVSQKQ